MISRIIVACAVVVFVLVGMMFIILHFPVPQIVTASPSHNQTVVERIQTIPSQILSRLPLLPTRHTNVSLVGVIVENHSLARPHHAGLEQALMIQEFMVEGFISRFVALFHVEDIPEEVGPIRSLRPYFLDGITPLTRSILHAGGSPEALQRAKEDDSLYAVNLLHFDTEGALRHTDVPAPHNLFATGGMIHDLLGNAEEEHLPVLSWPWYPVGVSDGGTGATVLSINFFNPAHNVTYTYDPLTKTYERLNGRYVSPARPSNVLLLEIPVDSISEHGRLSMTLRGSGDARLFHSGNVWEGQWSRQSEEDLFHFVDVHGEELQFARGQIWMTVVPDMGRVKFLP